MLNANDAANSKPVREAKQAVKDEKRRRKDLADKIDAARQEVEERKDELVETRADRAIGDASEREVDEARDALQQAKMRVSDLKDEHEAAGRAVEKLEGRARRVRDFALSKTKWKLKEEYQDRLEAACEAVEKAQQAVEEAAEVGSLLSNGEFDRVDFDSTLVPGALHGERTLLLGNGQGIDFGDATTFLREGVTTLDEQLEGNVQETYEDLDLTAEDLELE